MSKLKTNRGAAKRFKRTGTGAFKRRRANRNHILTKKPHKRKRHLRDMVLVKKCDFKEIQEMLRSY